MKLYFMTCKLLTVFTATLLTFFNPIQSFSQQAWTRVPSPDNSPTRNMIRSISGTSSSDVWTVGSYENSLGKDMNLIMHWNGSDWQIFPGTDLSISLNDLWSVTAISASDVWAAGVQNNFANTRSQLLHWNGTVWSHTLLPDITGGSFLFSIDAISANDIWAVGTQAGSPTDPAYAIHYNGSSWTEFPVPNAGSYSNRLYAVDGISSNDVWAVGRKSDHYGDFHAMAQHWNGSSWTNSSLPASVVADLGDLESVTMISSNDVWALGSTITGGLLMIHWNGISWSEVPTAGSSGGAIVARGTDVFSVGYRISKWNGTNWTVIDSLNQLIYPTLVSAISFSNGDIWAAGNIYDAMFHTLVYRTVNATPQFVHGNSQLITAPSNSPKNIDESLKVEDADISQVLIYTLTDPPTHGSISGLPDTAVTYGGYANTSGVVYTPTPGYHGPDQFQVKVTVGPYSTLANVNVNVLSILPVVISSYNIFKTGSTATIQWSTSSEINTSEFIIERSADAVNFNPIGRIAANGSGFNYRIVDPLPMKGWNYYILRMIDKDGRVTSSPIKSLKFEEGEIKPYSVYPNPVIAKKLNLLFNVAGDYTLTLYNQQGQRLLNREVKSSSPYLQIDLPGEIQAGIYILFLVNNMNIWSEKILIK